MSVGQGYTWHGTSKTPLKMKDGRFWAWQGTTLRKVKYAWAYRAGRHTSRPTVRTGSRGSDVKILQEYLKSNGQSISKVDGIFGSGTANAVKAFQRAKHLKVDGIGGSGTWGALGDGPWAQFYPHGGSTSTGGTGHTTSHHSYHTVTINARHSGRVISWSISSSRHVTKQVVVYYTGSSLRRVKHTMAVSTRTRKATIAQHSRIISAKVTYTYWS
jgi:peptidoglycan hydrolase-like protein with peptidoglycan-binding domain